MVDWESIRDRMGIVGEGVGKLLKRVLGSSTERFVLSLRPQVERINELESWAEGLDRSAMRERVEGWKRELREQQEHDQEAGLNRAEIVARVEEKLEELLPELFAMVREASKRTLGLRHYDVQLIGGMVLHRGNIAEMATGEGKTLVATLPASLNALAGRGVYVVTVNDYLARRDRDWMAPVYNYIGLSAGTIQSEYSPRERHPQYAADITYGTNNEFGFDYLRDNMKDRVEDQVQKKLFYAIVDEVDSILIDEARTPLIISGPAEGSTEKYAIADRIARRLQKDLHYEVNEKDHQCLLTDEGIVEAQNLAGVDSFYSGANMEWPHHIEQAVKAHNLYRRDVEYVVKDGEIIIVDEFTGRLMHGRRWSDGLHQAVEAKEGIHARAENQTLATITFQNYFRLFDKLAGMTGTAMTEAAEFVKIYDLEVVAIPTNRPVIRDDMHDVVFVREKGKWAAVAEKIKELHECGQPVLVGTTSIEKSALLADMLHRRGVPHEVLNAKQHEREAFIVAQAGRRGVVTVSTNMAGRGTDIVLGGNPEGILKERLRSDGIASDDPRVEDLRKEIEEQVKRESQEVKDAGGLFVFGTERHEARRVDNQLRGRSGRQGDPGASVFYLSLEDDLMRIFYRDWVRGFMEKMGMSDDQPIESGMVTRAIARAQKKVEQRNYEIRKNLLEYDEVMDIQRKEIYGMRQEVLEGFELKERIFAMIDDVVARRCQEFFGDVKMQDPDVVGLSRWIKRHFLAEIDAKEIEESSEADPDTGAEFIRTRLEELYEIRESEEGAENMRRIERYLLLNAIDTHWKEHLYAMDALRAGVGLRGYAQKDPKIEYKREGYENFERTLQEIAEEVTGLILKVRLKPIEEEVSAAASTASSDPGDGEPADAPQPPAAAEDQVPVHHAFDAYQRQRQMMNAAATRDLGDEKKGKSVRRQPGVGRNDPCPCGSGKKYKKCCGRPS